MRRVTAGSGRLAPVLALLAFATGAGSAIAQEAIPLRGRVVEAGTGAPVGGAEVRLVGAGAVVTTEDGAWSLGPVRPGRYRVVVRHIGYVEQDCEVTVAASGASALRIALTPRPLSLDAVVVTASRRPQRLKDVAVATEVVGPVEIRESGAADLSAVLIERTGIALEGGHPVGAGVMIQGLGSERVLVLLDGQPFIGRISGRLDLSRIPTSMIDRVEVVKGPQSTLYGSEAMGGVVNVITRAPERGVWSGVARVTGGTQGRWDAAASVLGGVGPLAYGVDAGRRAVEMVPGHAGRDGVLAVRYDGQAKLQWQLGAGRSVSAAVVALDERQRWRTGQLYHFSDNRQWGARLGAAWSAGAHRIAPLLYATEFVHLARKATTPEPVAGSGQTERQRLFEAELVYGYARDRWAVDAGLEASREAIVSDRVAGRDRSLDALEPFVQATVSGERWSLVPGLRLSWSERWGTHWTPRLAALVRPDPRLALRASVGRGYRAPDFKELYLEFLNVGPSSGYRVRGNPELEPETSRNVTLGLEWTGERLYLRTQLFDNRFDDFIESRLVGDSSGVALYTYGNVEAGVTRGVELEAGLTWRGVRLEGGYGYLSAEHAEGGEPLLGRPAHTGRVSASYATPVGLRASLVGVYTGATPVRRTEDGGVVERAGFTRVDLRIAHELPRGFELAAGADNVFDVQPDEWPGYMGRQFYLTLGWRGGREAR